jgi:hypothetical protein
MEGGGDRVDLQWDVAYATCGCKRWGEWLPGWRGVRFAVGCRICDMRMQSVGWKGTPGWEGGGRGGRMGI